MWLNKNQNHKKQTKLVLDRNQNSCKKYFCQKRKSILDINFRPSNDWIKNNDPAWHFSIYPAGWEPPPPFCGFKLLAVSMYAYPQYFCLFCNKLLNVKKFCCMIAIIKIILEKINIISKNFNCWLLTTNLLPVAN